jgi:hypothetical protein
MVRSFLTFGGRLSSLGAVVAVSAITFGACTSPKSDKGTQICMSAADCEQFGVGYDCQLRQCVYVGLVGGFDAGREVPVEDTGVSDGSLDSSLEEGGRSEGGIGEAGLRDGEVSEAGLGSGFDPHASRRQAVLAGYCTLLATYPCLDYAGLHVSPVVDPAAPVADKVARCAEKEDVDAFLYPDAMNACFTEWDAAATCASVATYACPCADSGDCELPPILSGTEGSCATERAAFVTCVQRNAVKRTVIGIDATCNWVPSAAAGTSICHVDCAAGTTPVSTGDCLGPPGGPTRCTCTANGAAVMETPGVPYSFYADDCAGAARLLADGKCLGSG